VFASIKSVSLTLSNKPTSFVFHTTAYICINELLTKLTLLLVAAKLYIKFYLFFRRTVEG
jgi:hypothetical protein